MFYATKIKSVTNGAAFDVTGKRLTFIGYLPVKAGDTVFTDGKVIFGNVPPKGSPAVFADESGGIPVLAVDIGGNELRGYFDLRGKFKKYKIAGDEWIVNDKKNYKHDDDEATIIDAEISDDGKLYTVEKVVNDSGVSDDDRYYRYGPFHFAGKGYYNYSAIRFSGIAERVTLALDFYIPAAKADFVERDGTVIKSRELIVSKNGDKIATINFAEAINELETATKKIVYIGDIAGCFFEEHTKSRACLLNFKIFPSGSWVALLDVELWAEYTYKHNSAYSDGFYYDDSSVAHKRLLVKINSDEVIEKLYERANYFPIFIYSFSETVENADPLPIPQNQPKDTFPYYAISGFSAFPIDWVSTGPTHKGEWVTLTLEDGTMVAGYWTWNVRTVYDSRNWRDAPDYDRTVVEVVEDFTFPVQDGYHAKIKNVYDLYGRHIDKWKFGAVCSGDKELFSALLPGTNAHLWNMSLATLKGGAYLFGVHKDTDRDIYSALYKISADGDVELIAYELKNFRLRELKKISKAKE